jgi:hypothetical protein
MNKKFLILTIIGLFIGASVVPNILAFKVEIDNIN